MASLARSDHTKSKRVFLLCTLGAMLFALFALACSETPTTESVGFNSGVAYPLVDVQPKIDTISVGGSRTLSAKLTDVNGYSWTCASCSWKSSDPTVATVTGVGTTTLKALKNGTVTVTATTGSATTGSYTIKVGQITPPTGGTPVLQVLPALDTITKGATRALTASITDGSGTTSTCATCTWTSSDTTVATVAGVNPAQLSALKAGSVTITAANGSGLTGSRTITVILPPGGTPVLQVLPALDTITKGATRALTASITDGSGNVSTCASCTWTSSDTTVAKVTGVNPAQLSALKAGSVTITAANGSGLSGSRTITVKDVVALPAYPLVEVLPVLDTISVGASRTLSAKLTDQTGNTWQCASCTWTSSDSSIATVTGVGTTTLKALKNGVVTVTAMTGSKTTGARTIRVSGGGTTPSNYPLVKVLPVLDTITKGASRTLNATLTDSLGNTTACSNCTWLSSDSTVARVTGVGNALLTALKAGTTTITALSGTRTGTHVLTVKEPPPPPPPSIYPLVKVLPALDTITKGASRTLNATLTDSLGNATACSNCTWRSSDSTVARVTGIGNAVLTALKAGTTTITALSGTRTGTLALIVKEPPPPPPAPGTRAGYYVTTTGNSTGDGSITKPWNIVTALAHPAIVKPGDTIWLRGGTYNGRYTSTLRGVSGSPIIVRAYPGERVTIDGNITVTGSWAWYWGFEVVTSSLKRVSALTGSAPLDIGPDGAGVEARGPNNKYINLIVHDTRGGFGFMSGAVDAEIYGCLVYNNGWTAPDRGHGHGIYAQNQSGTKRIVDNIVFNQFGWGLHIYGSSAAYLRNFYVEGNVSFTNGSISPLDGSNPDVLIGGGSAAGGITFKNNFTYQPGGHRTVKLGYDELNDDLTATGNYLVGETQVINWRTIRFTGNTLSTGLSAPSGAKVTLWHLSNGAPLTGHTWNSNRYYVPTTSSLNPFSFALNGSWSYHNFAAWQSKTGFDLSGSTFYSAGPTGINIFVRPNLYEKGRAHVVIYNWSGYGSASVDLSTTLKPGDRFEVRHSQDYYGAPVMTGTYAGGNVSIPLAARSPVNPLGSGWATPPTISPRFNVFVVVKT